MEEYTDEELVALSEVLPAVDDDRSIDDDDYDNAAPVDSELNEVDA